MVTYFDKWLVKNIDRFKYRPIKIGFESYRFDGINQSIVLQITRDIREITILYYSPNMLNTDSYNCEYDMRDISWFDRVKHIRDKGYCDLGWLEEYKKDRYYPTFKPKLCNRNKKLYTIIAIKGHSLKIYTTNKVA